MHHPLKIVGPTGKPQRWEIHLPDVAPADVVKETRQLLSEVEPDWQRLVKVKAGTADAG